MHSNLTAFVLAMFQTKRGKSRKARRQRVRQLTSERLEARELLAFDLVKDINTFPNLAGANPTNLIDINGTVFFSAYRSGHGVELWKSDGTEAGTVMVKDITVGSQSSSPTELTNLNGTLYFATVDDFGFGSLWRSDGTESGTVIVKSFGGYPKGLMNANGTLFFDLGYNSTSFYGALWKSDGSTSGTSMFMDILSVGDPKLRRTEVNGKLYFVSYSAENGYQLWRTDANHTTAVLVKNSSSEYSLANPKNLCNVGGTLFFSGFRVSESEGFSGPELWSSDGTDAGTKLVSDIRNGLDGSYPSQLTNVDGILYFSANDGVNGYELWKSDGTADGTVMVKDIAAGEESSSPSDFTNVNGELYFRAQNAELGLWKSDGTSAGTVSLSTDANLAPWSPQFLTNVAGTLFFTASEGVNGQRGLWKHQGPTASTVQLKANMDARNLANINGTLFFGAGQLWKSDGSEAGTVLVKTIQGGTDGSNPSKPIDVNGTLFFSATDGVHGFELWKSDGTAAGTVMVKDIRSGQASGNPTNFFNANGTLYFFANDGTTGTELWKSDGTAAGTILVKDIRSGPLGSYPRNLTTVGDTLYFAAIEATTALELWKTDGTTAGTVLVKDIRPGTGASLPANLTNFNGKLYFTASDGVSGIEIWSSDGTASGTNLLKDINPGADGSNAGFRLDRALLTNFGGFLFFVARDPVNGSELWKTDGTSAGTVLVKDIRPGSGDSDIWPGTTNFTPRLMNVGGLLFFSANDGANGAGLWRSDGTATGTFRLGADASYPSELTDVNGTLFFKAINTEQVELWKSDGTQAGTVLVKEPNPNNSGSIPFTPFNFLNVNGTLFFTATDGQHGYELWKSDGTANGTFMLKDIAPGAAASQVVLFGSLNGNFYFVANDLTHGEEMWRTDGTQAGTRMVRDLIPGTGGMQITNITTILTFNQSFLMALNTPEYGAELWRFVPNSPPTLSVANPAVSGVVLSTITNNGTWNDASTDTVTLTASIGSVVKNANGTWSWSVSPSVGLTNQLVTITATDQEGDSTAITFALTAIVDVVDRKVYYSESGFESSAGLAAALDSNKILLRSNSTTQTSSFVNVSSYARGLNGVYLSVAGLASTALTTADFIFRQAPDGASGLVNPSTWNSSPNPSAIVATAGSATAAATIQLKWANNQIQNTWLQIIVKANSNTGLTTPAVFYVGHALAEVNGVAPYRVTVADLVQVQRSISNDLVSSDNLQDINKDRRVTVADLVLIQSRISNNVLLRNIIIPPAGSAEELGFANAPPMLGKPSQSVIHQLPPLTSSLAMLVRSETRTVDIPERRLPQLPDSAAMPTPNVSPTNMQPFPELEYQGPMSLVKVGKKAYTSEKLIQPTLPDALIATASFGGSTE